MGSSGIIWPSIFVDRGEVRRTTIFDPTNTLILRLQPPKSAAIMAPRQKKVQAWVSSEGKKLLDRDVRKGRVTRATNEIEAYNMHPAEYDICGSTPAEARRLFAGRLESALTRGEVNSNRSAQESVAYQQDRAVHPRPALDFHGTPQWEGSEAQKRMREDVKNKVHESLNASQLQASRPEYADYSAQQIGQHASQEARLQKWKKYYPKRIKSLPPSP